MSVSRLCCPLQNHGAERLYFRLCGKKGQAILDTPNCEARDMHCKQCDRSYRGAVVLAPESAVKNAPVVRIGRLILAGGQDWYRLGR